MALNVLNKKCYTSYLNDYGDDYEKIELLELYYYEKLFIIVYNYEQLL